MLWACIDLLTFTNFARLYFPHFTTFRNQTLLILLILVCSFREYIDVIMWEEQRSSSQATEASVHDFFVHATL